MLVQHHNLGETLRSKVLFSSFSGSVLRLYTEPAKPPGSTRTVCSSYLIEGIFPTTVPVIFEQSRLTVVHQKRRQMTSVRIRQQARALNLQHEKECGNIFWERLFA